MKIDGSMILRHFVILLSFSFCFSAILSVCGRAQDEAIENGDRMLWAAQKVKSYIGLNTDHPVSVEFLSDKERIQDVMRMFFQRDYPDDKYWAMNALMVKFGFSLFEDETEDEIVTDYTRGILGVYDDEDKQIYIVEASLSDSLSKERYDECDLTSMRGVDPVWDDWMNHHQSDIVLVHEATHALQDQAHDLYDWHQKLKWNDDANLAIRSMIEGQAELVEYKYTMEALRISDYRAAFYNYGMSWNMDLFAAYDQWIEENSDDRFGTCEGTMTFLWWLGNVPYIFGQIFMQKIEGEQGLSRTNDTFTHCPLSSEQVMNSDKFFSKKDEDRPTFIDLPSFDDLLDLDDWQFLDYNSMGQLKLYLLCRDLYYDPINECQPMSEGWDGDRYIVWRNEDDEIQLAWYTTWDTERDAKEFYTFYNNARQRRGGSGGNKSSGDGFQLILDDEDSMYTAIQGKDVIIIEGPLIQDDAHEDWASLLWEAETYEATYDICTMSAEEFDDGYIGYTGVDEETGDDTSGEDEPDEDGEEES